MNDSLVWIDCEMTGLDLKKDALIEVACLITDGELNQLDEGINVVIKPPQEALDQMGEFVTQMHTTSGLLAELENEGDSGRGRAARLGPHPARIPSRKGPLCGTPLRPTALSSPGTCPASMSTCTTAWWTSPASKNCCAAGIPGCTSPARKARRPPGAGRHHRKHPGTALLPRGRVRAPAWTGQCHGQGHRR